MPDYITGISPLGLNFGGAFGDYSSYLPSSMGIGNMTGTTGMTGGLGYPYSMGMGMGMSNMMAPMMEYQQYMARLQNQLDYEQLNHSSAMHKGMVSAEVEAYKDSLSGMAQKTFEDAAIQDGVMNLYHKIMEGDQNGVVQEYDRLESVVLSKFKNERNQHGCVIATAADARRYIANAYANIINATANDGAHDLESDIKAHCDGAFKQGIVSGFRGEFNQRYLDETLNHIYGRRIDNRQSKNDMELVGKGIGIVGAGIRDVVGGAAIGAGVVATTFSAANLITLPFKTKWWAGRCIKGLSGWGAAIGATALLTYGIIKKFGNNKSEA